MATTPKQRRQHNAFLKRQRANEKVYYVKFLNYFESVYSTAANIVESEGTNQYLTSITSHLQEKRLNNIYLQLYREVMLKEAEIEYAILPGMGRKDFISDIVNLFRGNQGEAIRLWRTILGEYLETRILSRITEVTSTTVKKLSEIIEKAISEGLGAKETARLIRDQTKFNRNRSLVVARTETVTAANQGKYMAAETSPFLMEKSWITTLDGRERPSHREMDGVPFIDLDAYFFLDAPKMNGLEQAQYPCADTLSAGNTIQCRCSLTLRIKTDSEGNPIRKL